MKQMHGSSRLPQTSLEYNTKKGFMLVILTMCNIM